MKTILFIPADIRLPVEVKNLVLDLETMSGLVGGNLEVVGLMGPLASLYINEEGKLRQLPMNVRATALIQRHKPNLVDVIVGDVFVCGPPDKDGNDTDCPDDYLRLAG